MKIKKQMVEIWGDVVEPKALIMSIILSLISTMGAYFMAPINDKSKQLFFGLGGSVLGFFTSIVLIKPKRDIKIEKW